MEKQVIGVFTAVTFDNEVHEFIVYDNHTIDCPKLNLESMYRINLKPRFELYGDDIWYISKAPSKIRDGLIREYNIDSDLFDYLKSNGMIRYSVDMAYLYGFEDKKGFDSKSGYCGISSPYKWAKKKGPILVKQKNGKFN